MFPYKPAIACFLITSFDLRTVLPFAPRIAGRFGSAFFRGMKAHQRKTPVGAVWKNAFPATHKMPANAAWVDLAGRFAANTPTTAKLKIRRAAVVPARLLPIAPNRPHSVNQRGYASSG